MDRPGGLAVKVYNSDPEKGDPFDFVFYLEPPYTGEQLRAKAMAMAKLWGDVMEKRGYDRRTRPELSGPFKFEDNGREDLSDRHRGDDEWCWTAWYRNRTPLIVGADVIDQWNEIRAEQGVPISIPSRIGDDRVGGKVWTTQNDWLSDAEKLAGKVKDYG